MSVPNSALWNKPIKNYSRLAERQLSVAVGIPYGGDLAKALAVLRGLLDDPRVLHTPSPAVAVTDLGENAVTVTLTCWARAADLGVLGNDLRLRATERLGNAGFAPPLPRREVRVESQERPQAARSRGHASARGPSPHKACHSLR
jgi:small conductance mechanosensitive channel